VQRQRRIRQRVLSVVFVHQNRRPNELSRPCGCSYVQEYLQVLEQAMIMPVWRFGAECGAFRPKNNLLRPIYYSFPHLIFPPPSFLLSLLQAKTQPKTYNSGYSPVVTHLTTNPPVSCLSTAERTGSSIFKILWSYVKNWMERWDYV
jgi:hypothetical protein